MDRFRMNRRRLVQAGALGAGAAFFAGRMPSSGVAAQGTPQKGGTLRVGRAGDFVHFDPFFAVTVNLPMYRQLYNTLVVYDEKLNVQPQLAESWEYSDDKLSLVFHLRKGVTFHNGRDFTADDVVKNVQRAQDASLSHSMLGYTKPISDIKAVDPATVQFTFSEPANGIWDFLTVMGIVAPEAFEAPAITKPIGTGPFKFVSWNPGQEATFQKYEGYWEEGLPYLDEVVVKALPDQQAAIANLEGGELDIVQGVPLNDIPRLKTSDSITLNNGVDAVQFYTLYCNVARPPFDNEKVRQAFAHAIDQQTIVDTVLFGVGKASDTPFPEWSLAYDASLVDYLPFDLDKAKALLAEAGHGDGLETTVITTSEAAEQRGMAQIIQSDLAKIGVKLNIKDISSADWNQVWPAKDYDLMISAAGFSQKDPSTLFNSMSGFRLDDNRTNFSTPQYSEFVTTTAGLTDPKERHDKYVELAKYMIEQANANVISFKYIVFGVRNNVNDLTLQLDDDMDLGRVWLAK